MEKLWARMVSGKSEEEKANFELRRVIRVATHWFACLLLQRRKLKCLPECTALGAEDSVLCP